MSTIGEIIRLALPDLRYVIPVDGAARPHGDVAIDGDGSCLTDLEGDPASAAVVYGNTVEVEILRAPLPAVHHTVAVGVQIGGGLYRALEGAGGTGDIPAEHAVGGIDGALKVGIAIEVQPEAGDRRAATNVVDVGCTGAVRHLDAGDVAAAVVGIDRVFRNPGTGGESHLRVEADLTRRAHQVELGVVELGAVRIHLEHGHIAALLGGLDHQILTSQQGAHQVGGHDAPHLSHVFIHEFPDGHLHGVPVVVGEDDAVVDHPDLLVLIVRLGLVPPFPQVDAGAVDGERLVGGGK